jgi:aminoglycoside phosphotransferase (APT) family kinase protein
MSTHDMAIRPKPAAETPVDQALIQALLAEQHPDLAGRPIAAVGEGWDNAVYRLGDDLAVRVPRRAASAVLVDHEQRWLPQLSRRLPLPVPAPVRLGVPGCGYPWRWSIVPWFPGETALAASTPDAAAFAATLAGFLIALHEPAPPDAPQNPWRGVPLAARAASVDEYLERTDGVVDRVAVLTEWRQAMSVRPWSRPPVWIHGDLHPGNLLIDRGHLSAVIDFGDLTAGDPATDLSVAWMLPIDSRRAFCDSYNANVRADGDTWRRARGWALVLGLAYLAHSHGNERMRALGHATITAASSHPA